jgi:hypothetical protein
MPNIYKHNEDETWGNYAKVIFPDGQIMDGDNHDFERDGFFYSEVPPKEFLEYEISNNI